jgi:hypothetical protein
MADPAAVANGGRVGELSKVGQGRSFEVARPKAEASVRTPKWGRPIAFVLLAILTPPLAAAEPGEDVKTIDARDRLADTANFIVERKGNLLIANRERDIFGLPQDIKKEEERQAKQGVAKKEPEKPTIPIARILQQIPVTMLDPAGDRLLLDGGPPLRAGETLEVVFGGETIRLRLDGVRAAGAYFSNVMTGEQGLCTMDRLPEGISRNGRASGAVDGIQRLNQSVPRTLNLGSGNDSKDNGLSRR